MQQVVYRCKGIVLELLNSNGASFKCCRLYHCQKLISSQTGSMTMSTRMASRFTKSVQQCTFKMWSKEEVHGEDAAYNSAATWCNYGRMSQSNEECFPEPCWINSTTIQACFKCKSRSKQYKQSQTTRLLTCFKKFKVMCTFNKTKGWV